VPTNSAETFADGVAVRVPSEEALAIMQPRHGGLIEVTDDEVAGGDPRASTPTPTRSPKARARWPSGAHEGA